MTDFDTSWADKSFIKVVPVEEFYLQNRAYISKTFKRLLFSKPIYLARYLYDNPTNGNKVFDCLLDYVSPSVIQQLQTKQALLIYDISYEGNFEDFPLDQTLRNSHQKYHVPRESLCGLTGATVLEHIPNDVNILPYGSLAKFTQGNNLSYYLPNYSKQRQLENHYNGYYFSAMTRKYRYWRSWAVYHLLNSSLSMHALISHVEPPVPANIDTITEYMCEVSPLVSELDQSPLFGDSTVRSVLNQVNSELHANVLFHLSLETYQDRGSMPFTEKTFKSMVAETPTLIWGIPGANTIHLEQAGFRTYHNWFDLSFDTVEDTEQRWHLLQKEIARVCATLDQMTHEQRIQWAIKDSETAEHNKFNVMRIVKQGICRLEDYISDFFVGN